MDKRTITRLFVGSLIALAGGLVLGLVAVALAYASGAFEMDGPDVVGVHATPFGWAMLAVGVLAVFVVIGAAIAQFVAWIAAVLNTAQLPDKTWFAVLLVTGLLSFGFIAMVAYVIAGPDSRRPVAVSPQSRPFSGATAA